LRAGSYLLSFVLFAALAVFFGSLLFSLQYFAIAAVLYFSVLVYFIVLISRGLSSLLTMMYYYCWAVVSLFIIPFLYLSHQHRSHRKFGVCIPKPVWAVGFAHEQTLRDATLAVFCFLILKRLQHNMSRNTLGKKIKQHKLK
jgi:hypothetical protein